MLSHEARLHVSRVVVKNTSCSSHSTRTAGLLFFSSSLSFPFFPAVFNQRCTFKLELSPSVQIICAFLWLHLVWTVLKKKKKKACMTLSRSHWLNSQLAKPLIWEGKRNECSLAPFNLDRVQTQVLQGQLCKTCKFRSEVNSGLVKHHKLSWPYPQYIPKCSDGNGLVVFKLGGVILDLRKLMNEAILTQKFRAFLRKPNHSCSWLVVMHGRSFLPHSSTADTSRKDERELWRKVFSKKKKKKCM